MRMDRLLLLLGAFALVFVMAGRPSAAPPDAVLPADVKAVWDLGKAYRERTPTRERVCLNGLWRWQPAEAVTEAAVVPADRWGYFKVPGCWPGFTDYMQKDSQTVFAHPTWKDEPLRDVTAAWYQREITVPANWTGRRITLEAEYLNSLAVVYLDGRRVGEIRFPGGELELTAACRPGGGHLLSLLVVAMPLRAVMLSHSDMNAAREVRGRVARRGLCGDVFLVGTPRGARIVDVKIETSVCRGEITVDAGLQELAVDARYTLRAEIRDSGRRVRQLASPVFRAADVREGRFAFRQKWLAEKLWDLHTPGNLYSLQLSLREAGGKLLDAASPARFGFREFWIEGRDFYLNGSRIYLSALPLDNAQVGAALANYAAARESLERLKSFGINFVYTHNYGCEPGTHLSFAEILRAADDAGMLVALSQPHFAQYDWQAPDAERTNGYALHAEFYVRVAGNHPSVVAYATSHNTTGYGEDMNPDTIDGLQDPRSSPGEVNNARRALRAEAIVMRLDPSRIVYHHSSGNLGAMHTVNFYANFVPIQELSDWFEHWATRGVKPLFLCEYGVPFSWDWAMYRGWYNGQREFGSAVVPWEFCLAEWNAQFLGDRAYRISPMEEKNLRWEAEQFRAGRLWHRWDYPHALGSSVFDERNPVFAMYLRENWRALRTWGVSATSPWEHAIFWRARDGIDRRRKELPVDWERLQRPGFSPDYVEERYERMDLAFERADWVPTAAAQALLRNNGPLLAYIGGKPARFTSKDHNFVPGETVEKQLILLNNSRATVACDCRWSLNLPRAVTGSRKVSVPTGEQERIPLRFDLPDALPAGSYEIRAAVRFSTGETQEDRFTIHVSPRLSPPRVNGKIALFDPRGETARLLDAMQLRFQRIDATADLAPYDVLIVGKAALTRDGPGSNLDRVRDGLKVIVFEQSAEVLEQRFGFRVAEYGLRWVFPRVPGHPVLDGIHPEHLRDWRGAATLLPPRLHYTMRPRYGPTVKWCGIDVPRLWRCGCRGNVASVLIEKPARGDFLPIVDGGYSLQYSPLLEYREGKGLVLFCQMDVTGRTEGDPAADRLTRNLLEYVSAWKPRARRQAVYAGDPAGRRYLEAAGFSLAPDSDPRLSADRVLIVGPSGGQKLVGRAREIRDWLDAGGRVLAIGLDEPDANAFLSDPVRMKREEHIAAFFGPSGLYSPLAGIGPADVHNRDPRALPFVAGGATPLGNGVLAQAGNGRIVFCQLAPWQFDPKGPMNVKRTFRRAAFLLARLLGNMGVAGSTPVLGRFRSPVDAARGEKRWLEGLYLDTPEEWDDPYRFFRW
jgi:beta-galactosidase/beta-glucuronidase